VGFFFFFFFFETKETLFLGTEPLCLGRTKLQNLVGPAGYTTRKKLPSLGR
jgi:hypothetical protein